ncbi:MAG: hypothetical protein HY613_05195, partial [Candidatus Rokubacteria bacterium]|nr:hypothetical protein [Candidatus Rokubacteria bacterium]
MSGLGHSLLSILAVGLAAAACGTGGQMAMSVEEAKQVTASFTRGTFVPPPRTINDITAVLDQQKLADPAAMAKARAKADERAPDTTNPDTLAAFYYQRGLAAGVVGLVRQEIDDLTEAARWAERGSGRAEHEILFWLSIAEIHAGNFSRALEYTRRAVTKVPRFQEGWLVPLNASLVGHSARIGDMDAAAAALEAARRAFDASRVWSIFIPAQYMAAMRAGLAEAQANILHGKGQHLEAERFYREAVAELAAAPDFAVWRDYLTGRLAEVLVRQERLIEAEGEARSALLRALE